MQSGFWKFLDQKDFLASKFTSLRVSESKDEEINIISKNYKTSDKISKSPFLQFKNSANLIKNDFSKTQQNVTTKPSVSLEHSKTTPKLGLEKLQLQSIFKGKVGNHAVSKSHGLVKSSRNFDQIKKYQSQPFLKHLKTTSRGLALNRKPKLITTQNTPSSLTPKNELKGFGKGDKICVGGVGSSRNTRERSLTDKNFGTRSTSSTNFHTTSDFMVNSTADCTTQGSFAHQKQLSNYEKKVNINTAGKETKETSKIHIAQQINAQGSLALIPSEPTLTANTHHTELTEPTHLTAPSKETEIAQHTQTQQIYKPPPQLIPVLLSYITIY